MNHIYDLPTSRKFKKATVRSLPALFVFMLSILLSGMSRAQMRITEYMYDGANQEFIEFTNTGATPVDMAGWSFDDDSRVAGTVNLSAFGMVQPGESVILAESSDAAFRAAWSLCDNVKVIGNLTTNLGRNDEINLFDASSALVDRLTYGDQNFPGTIRTQNKSGYVSAAGSGANDAAAWTLSAVADAEASFTSSGGDTGSPGKSTRATVAFNPCPPPPPMMRITEYMYDGADLEFIEFTNVGTTPVDMAGWSFDDDSHIAGTVSLGAFGIVQPGESVILAENNAAAFRTAWGLCNEVKVIGSLTTNLGRNDEINLFDASGNLVDRLTYGDQNFPGTIRTQLKSGYVSATGLGANLAAEWTLSAVGDGEGSFASAGGDIGSPGKSTRATVAFNPCPPPPSPGVMRITEFMYDGNNMEFIEFTNVSNIPVDMTGWSFDDDSQLPGTVSLSAFGMVKPGESVILAENNATAFRTAWGLCDNVKVIGSLTTNLGRNDEINLFDASGNLIDRLTYGDQNFPGTIRTQNKSGIPNAAGLGTNTIANWIFSAAGDAEGSFTSSGGDMGSPGKSTLATVAYNPCPPGAIRITEYMYDGANQEFIEFTNAGATPVDMTGWSFDDDSQTPGTVSLGAFGIVQPGESVILAENSITGFRTAWNLCNGIKIIGGLSANLGRADEINLFDASGNLVDRLTYGDQNFPGTIRTQNKSGIPNAAGLGSNTIANWIFSAAGDAEGSYTSSGGDIGSPGKSTQVVVAYNPCAAVVGAPEIVMDVTATTNFLDGNAVASPASPYAISGVINDPADPAKTAGIDFTISDDETAVNDLTVTVSSSNTTVVPAANLMLTGSGASRNLKITPAAVGYSSITVTVNDGANISSYTLYYAASAASVSAMTRFHTGAADASTAQMIDANYMLVADDENQVLRLYDRQSSGLPLNGFDYTGSLGLTDISGGAPRETDIESSVRVGDRIYWLTSHGNSSDGDIRVNRYRLFATDVSGTGSSTALNYIGRYDGLRTDLLSWDANNLHGLGANYFGFVAGAAAGVMPEIGNASGFNIEGIVMAPDGVTAYLCFRAPIVPVTNRTKALIIPLTNLASLVSGNPAAEPAAFGAPVQIDLGGLGIREIKKNASGQYLIIAGPHDGADNFKLYTWTGNVTDAPVLRSADLASLNANGSFESIVDVPDPLTASSQLQLLVDNGDFVYYNNGTIAKELPDNNHKKSRSEIVTLGTPVCNGPVVTCPADTTVSSEAGQCGAVVNYAATINCPETTISYSHAPGSFFPVGSTTVTVTAVDAANNTSTCSFVVTVTDNELPVISCPQSIVQHAGNNCSKTIATVNPVFSDNCEVVRLAWTFTGATTANSPASGINYAGTKNFKAGVTTVTYTATDAFGNEASCSFTVTVNEQVPPVISCPSDKIVNTDPDQCYATNVNLGNPYATDNCGVASVTNDAPAQFSKGITYVKWTVTDNSGNTKTCTQKVTVKDNQAPVVNCPGDMEEVVGNNCSALVTAPNPVFSDNCEVAKLTWIMTGATTKSSDNNGINYVGTKRFNAGVTTVKYTVKDAAGNSSTCSFTVTVIDNIAPVLSCPFDINANVYGNYCGTFVQVPYPWVMDNCGVARVTWEIYGATEAHSSYYGINYVGSRFFNVGTSTVIYTVEDFAGNATVSSFNVIVTDNIEPFISCLPDKTVYADKGQCYATNVYLGNPFVSDNCGVASVTNDAPEQFPGGVTYVKWTVTDNSGNTKTCTQKVTVVDNQAPVISCPTGITQAANSYGCTASIEVPEPTFSDNCGVVKLNWTMTGATTAASPNNGINYIGTKTFNGGTTFITYTAKDASGNSKSCSFTITVNSSLAGSISSLASTICENSPVPVVFNAAGGTGPYKVVINGKTYDNINSGSTIVTGNSPALHYSLWSDNAVPAATLENDGQPVEVGMKFRVSTNGQIKSIRFYKGSNSDAGTYTLKLYHAASRTLLASVDFSNQTATGWQTVDLASPVSVSANTTYLVSYYSATGNYADDLFYFTSPRTNGPLTGLASGADGLNGVYRYGSGFPTNSYQASNYWVDVVFVKPSSTIQLNLTSITDANNCTVSGNLGTVNLQVVSCQEVLTRNGSVPKTVSAKEAAIPQKAELGQNYPNPFGENTLVNFSIPAKGKVKMVLYDLNGRAVQVWIDQIKEAGSYTIPVNRNNLAAGIYYYRMEWQGETLVRKLMIQ